MFKQRVHTSEARQWFPPHTPGHAGDMLAQTHKEEIPLSEDQKRLKQGPFFRVFHKVGDLYGKPEVEGGPLVLFFLQTEKGPTRVFPGDWIVSDNGVKRVVPGGEFAEKFEVVA